MLTADSSFTCKSYYFICDGGYLQWPVLICPTKYGNEHDGKECAWGMMGGGSVRKVIEYNFGILKGQWLFLKNWNNLTRSDHIENVLTSCCMLHNILLDSDRDFEFVGSDTKHHVAHTVQGDCLELHVPTTNNNLNEKTAGKQSKWWNRVQLLVLEDNHDEFRKTSKLAHKIS